MAWRDLLFGINSFDRETFDLNIRNGMDKLKPGFLTTVDQVSYIGTNRHKIELIDPLHVSYSIIICTCRFSESSSTIELLKHDPVF